MFLVRKLGIIKRISCDGLIVKGVHHLNCNLCLSRVNNVCCSRFLSGNAFNIHGGVFFLKIYFEL